MRRTTHSTALNPFMIALVALVAFAVGCASNTEPVEEEVQETGSEFKDAPPPPAPPQTNVRDTTISAANITISPVYFDLDESTIKPEFESILQGAAQALRESGASVTIEGHCDERGTREYNLALGERRAAAVRTYLQSLGVRASQISTVSFGEERPVDPGHTESAWAKNRRAVLDY